MCWEHFCLFLDFMQIGGYTVKYARRYRLITKNALLQGMQENYYRDTLLGVPNKVARECRFHYTSQSLLLMMKKKNCLKT